MQTIEIANVKRKNTFLGLGSNIIYVANFSTQSEVYTFHINCSLEFPDQQKRKCTNPYVVLMER